MDQYVRIPALWTELRIMGWAFLFPIIVLIITSLFIFFNYGGIENLLLLSTIRNTLGIFPIPLISIWVISLFQDVIHREGKELFLSLPYQALSFGLLRVIRVTILYMIIFLIVFLILIFHSNEVLSPSDWYLPFVSILYFASLSFFIVLLTKNTLISYSVIGIYGALQYMVRGGISGSFYPFHWPNPKPLLPSHNVAISLSILSLFFILLAQWILTKKEYLAR